MASVRFRAQHTIEALAKIQWVSRLGNGREHIGKALVCVRVEDRSNKLKSLLYRSHTHTHKREQLNREQSIIRGIWK